MGDMMNLAFWRFKKELQVATENIREELDDHRHAINESTRDVAEVRELIGGLDEKLEKLNSRIDELYLLLGAEQSLTEREVALQQFLQTTRTLDEIAAFMHESLAGAEHLLRCLHFKGIHVYRVGSQEAQIFTINKDTFTHISLNNYL